MEKMSWYDAAKYLRDFNHKYNVTSKSTDGPTCVMVAVISEDSFDKPYTLEERSYAFTNKEKAFIAGMGGYSIFAHSLDGSDHCRLEGYLTDEHGGKNGWKVDYCYIKEENV
jgi:hypothetical protein